MSRWAVVAGVVVMVALIVTLDVLLLRQHFWLRLAVNVTVVGVFAVCYVLSARRPS